MSRLYPYLDSSKLIESIRKRCSLPENDALFSDEDILGFANDEMLNTVLPKIKSTQEEYFIHSEFIPLEASVDKYDIPERALANALRDISYVDSQGNEEELTRIGRDDRYEYNYSSYEAIPRRFYVENNQIVLLPTPNNTNGELKMIFLIRPNMLVPTDEVSKVESFSKGFVQINTFSASSGKTLVTTNSTHELSDGEIVEIANVTGADAASFNSTHAITTQSSNTFLIDLDYSTLTVNNSGLVYNNTTDIRVNNIPTKFNTSIPVDLLKTRSPHNFYNYDVVLRRIKNSSSILNIKDTDYSSKLSIGDTIAQQYETDIPGIPTELHRYLVSKVTERIMESMNDEEGYNKAVRKSAEDEQGVYNMIENRVTSAPLKVRKRHGFLRKGYRNRRG